MDKEESLLNSSSLVAVPVFQQRAGSRNSAKGKMKLDLGGLSDDGSEHPLVSANPFASLALASSMEGQVENRVMGPGPLKRARPVECLPPRSIPKSDKRKGKGKGKLGVSRGSLCLSLPILPQSHCCPDLDQEVSMSNPDRPTERECQDTSVVLRDQGSGDIVVDPDVMQDCSCHNSDNVMAEDQEKVLATSS